MRQLKRLILRVLGIPYWAQDTFLDGRRWSLTVSSHAIERAGQRYRQGDPQVIALEVLQAFRSGRVGDRTPGKKHHCKKARLAWTEEVERVYVLKRVRRGWVVATSLPTSWSDAVEAEVAQRQEDRKSHKATTKVAQAFIDAGFDFTSQNCGATLP